MAIDDTLTNEDLGNLYNAFLDLRGDERKQARAKIQFAFIRRADPAVLSTMPSPDLRSLHSWWHQCGDMNGDGHAAMLHIERELARRGLYMVLAGWGFRALDREDKLFQSDELLRRAYYSHEGVLCLSHGYADSDGKLTIPGLRAGDFIFPADFELHVPQRCALCRRVILDSTPPLFLSLSTGDELICGRCVAFYRLSVSHLLTGGEP